MAEEPFHIDYREESNDQFDFTLFILDALKSGFLKSGDFLILDNASLHHGSDIISDLADFLQVYGIEIVYLPAYSPELNPCELVFAKMKKFIRDYGNKEKETIFNRVLRGLATISTDDVLGFFHHCIFPLTLLPEFM